MARLDSEVYHNAHAPLHAEGAHKHQKVKRGGCARRLAHRKGERDHVVAQGRGACSQ